MASGNGKANIPSRKHKCSFIGCSKSKNRYPDLHFFQFPTSRPLICKEWIASCAKNLLIDMPEKKLKSRVVCQEHFTDKSFLNLMKKNLKKDAVPTIRRDINDQNQSGLSTGKITTHFHYNIIRNFFYNHKGMALERNYFMIKK